MLYHLRDHYYLNIRMTSSLVVRAGDVQAFTLQITKMGTRLAPLQNYDR